MIGCPGSGTATYTRRFDPLDGSVHLTLDDLRQALRPPDRQIYWTVRGGEWDRRAYRLLYAVKVAALDTALARGFSVVMAAPSGGGMTARGGKRIPFLDPGTDSIQRFSSIASCHANVKIGLYRWMNSPRAARRPLQYG